MNLTLTGPAGAGLHLDQAGLTITRAGETLLALQRATIEVYGITLPALAADTTQIEETTLQATFATARPDFRITLVAVATDDGFRLTWSATPPAPAVGLVFARIPGHHWYGMGERVVQPWPLDAASVVSDPFIPADHCRDGTLDIGTPLWLCSSGAALLVEEDAGELAVAINRDGNGMFQLVRRAPERPFGPDETAVAFTPPQLTLHVLIDDHLPAVQGRALRHLGHPTSAPPLDLFVRPIWTTWARYKMHITQEQVLQFAEEICARDYPRAVLEIDDRWQRAYGDLEFDPVKFPDPRALVEALHARGFRVTLWVPPFFDPQSAAFREAARHGYLLRHPATREPVLTRWWQGYGGLLDVSNPQALAWWLAGLRRLQSAYGVDGFKFDGGEGNFIPQDCVSMGPLTSTSYADQYVAFVARHFQWTEVRTGWHSQRQGLLFREWDKWSRWGLDNGLHAVLTQALTLGLIGYPFVLPDMIGGNAYSGEFPDAELIIRWTQLTALLPAMQFSLAPWDYGTEADTICRRYARLHADLQPVLERCLAEACDHGTPLVRPLFWHAPEDRATYTLDDQFMLGATLLVAPVLQPGRRQRPVYLPAGRWRDYWTDVVYQGPRQLADYPAPLETLPLFERMLP